jgi:hypothetical protein
MNTRVIFKHESGCDAAPINQSCFPTVSFLSDLDGQKGSISAIAVSSHAYKLVPRNLEWFRKDGKASCRQ